MKEEDEVLQGIWNVDTCIGFNQGRNGEQEKGKQAEKYVFIVAVEKLGNQHEDHNETQGIVHDTCAILLLQCLTK